MAEPTCCWNGCFHISVTRGEKHYVESSYFDRDRCDRLGHLGNRRQRKRRQSVLLPTSSDPNHTLRQSAMQLLQHRSQRLRPGLLHRSTASLLAQRFPRSSGRHLHVAVLWSLGEGRRHTTRRSQGSRLTRTTSKRLTKKGRRECVGLFLFEKSIG